MIMLNIQSWAFDSFPILNNSISSCPRNRHFVQPDTSSSCQNWNEDSLNIIRISELFRALQSVPHNMMSCPFVFYGIMEMRNWIQNLIIFLIIIPGGPHHSTPLDLSFRIWKNVEQLRISYLMSLPYHSSQNSKQFHYKIRIISRTALHHNVEYISVRDGYENM